MIDTELKAKIDSLAEAERMVTQMREGGPRLHHDPESYWSERVEALFRHLRIPMSDRLTLMRVDEGATDKWAARREKVNAWVAEIETAFA